MTASNALTFSTGEPVSTTSNNTSSTFISVPSYTTNGYQCTNCWQWVYGTGNHVCFTYPPTYIYPYTYGSKEVHHHYHDKEINVTEYENALKALEATQKQLQIQIDHFKKLVEKLGENN